MTIYNTSNKKLRAPGNNDDVNTWDVPLNTNWTGLDYALGGVTYINVTGQSGVRTMIGTYSDTAVNNQYPPNGIGAAPPETNGEQSTPSYIPSNIVIGGTLLSNIIYQIPTGVSGQWTVYNGAVDGAGGPYTVSFRSGSYGNTFAIPKNQRRLIVCDGQTNIISRSDSIDALQVVPNGTPSSLQFKSGTDFYGSSLRYDKNSGAFFLSPLTFDATIASSVLTTQQIQPLLVGMVIKNMSGTQIGVIDYKNSDYEWHLSSSTTTSLSTMQAFPASGNEGIALNVNSYESKEGIYVAAGSTAGTSKGINIKAGTNASDYSLRIYNAGTPSVARFNIDGYGSTYLATNSSSDLPALSITSLGTADSAVEINAAEDQYGITVSSGTTADKSFGIKIKAGTNQFDYPLYIQTDEATPFDLFFMRGAGGSIFYNKDGNPETTVSIYTNNDGAFNDPPPPPALSVHGGAYTATISIDESTYPHVIDCSKSNVFYINITASYTTELRNARNGQTINIIVNHGAGSTLFYISNPVKWVGGFAPVNSNSTDIYVLTYQNSTWYGSANVGYI